MKAASIANLGTCTITRAEMNRVIDGKERAWSLGDSHLEVQLDSLAAIALLQADGACDGSMLIWYLSFNVSCNEVGRYGSVMCTARRITSPIFWLITAIHWLSVATRFSYLTLLLLDHIGGRITRAVRAA
ncbi:hypothetical protein LINGRAHAP2_LOCUS9576 [Linum grandiflorum]